MPVHMLILKQVQLHKQKKVTQVQMQVLTLKLVHTLMQRMKLKSVRHQSKQKHTQVQKFIQMQVLVVLLELTVLKVTLVQSLVRVLKQVLQDKQVEIETMRLLVQKFQLVLKSVQKSVVVQQLMMVNLQQVQMLNQHLVLVLHYLLVLQLIQDQLLMLVNRQVTQSQLLLNLHQKVKRKSGTNLGNNNKK